MKSIFYTYNKMSILEGEEGKANLEKSFESIFKSVKYYNFKEIQ